MNRKKSAPVSSTPCPKPAVFRHVLSMFEDSQLSPITEPSQWKVPIEPQSTIPLSSKPSGVQRKGAFKKRRVESKGKAAPESTTAGVLKQLGEKAQDICSNVLSHSRNLYNMFPEPIILDSDEENFITPKKPPKKPKQDSKVAQSSTTKNQEEKSSTTKNQEGKSSATKNQEEKKIKKRVPGSSRPSCATRPAVERKRKKQSSVQSLNSVPASSKSPKTSRTNHQTKSKLTENHQSTNSSVVLLDDDDDSLFPVYPYQRGTSIYRTTIKKREKVRLSFELDEKFPIEWSGRRKKTADNKTERVPDVENNEVHKSKDVETNNNKKETIGASKETERRRLGTAEVLNEGEPKCNGDGNAGKDSHVVNGKKENPVLISRFEDVRFKLSNTSGGVIAKCLKTDQNDIGYLEVPANEVFKGERANVTFVVIEGKAKVLHLGMQHTLSPGDTIHISNDSGYQFESVGRGHVRFLYIKER